MTTSRGVVIATSRRATLVKVAGRIMCECPYLCDAVGERCEFDGKYSAKGKPIKSRGWSLAGRRARRPDPAGAERATSTNRSKEKP